MMMMMMMMMRMRMRMRMRRRMRKTSMFLLQANILKVQGVIFPGKMFGGPPVIKLEKHQYTWEKVREGEERRRRGEEERRREFLEVNVKKNKREWFNCGGWHFYDR
eukprot:763752-Hanusia_phi.AAC.5